MLRTQVQHNLEPGLLHGFEPLVGRLSRGSDVGAQPIVVREARLAFERIGFLRPLCDEEAGREERNEGEEVSLYYDFPRKDCTFLWNRNNASASPLCSVKLKFLPLRTFKFIFFLM